MRLLHLASRGFRNLADLDLRTDARFVVLHGDNAQGKTNTLEAIYLLATLKPLRPGRINELVAWGGAEAALAGRVTHEGLERRFRLDLREGARQVSLDGRVVHDLTEYFDGIRAIAFTPQDTEVITAGPKERRRWVDRAAFTARPAHLEVARAYRRALDQKAAALRERRVESAVIDALDSQLARWGATLADRRVALLSELGPHVAAAHAEIAGGQGALTLRYRTEAVGGTVAEREVALAKRLGASRDEERRRGRCLVGPQGDEVVIELDGRSARTFGSQGQVRSIVLALKLGELVAARARGDAPLFLLDDVGSELDAHRTRRLVEHLGSLGVQVFATTTDPAHLGELPARETLLVRVAGGRLESGPA